jgi:hypothetical protein
MKYQFTKDQSKPALNPTNTGLAPALLWAWRYYARLTGDGRGEINAPLVSASKLEAVRDGEHVKAIGIRIQSAIVDQPPAVPIRGPKHENLMPIRKSQSSVIQFFELEQEYPNEDAKAWYERLVGLDDHKRRLLVELELYDRETQSLRHTAVERRPFGFLY